MTLLLVPDYLHENYEILAVIHSKTANILILCNYSSKSSPSLGDLVNLSILSRHRSTPRT
jgi:hypothetical protein